MPQLGRVTPCWDCPWRVNAKPGWLGTGNPVSFFRQAVTSERAMPCHAQIDYRDPHWRETQLPGADFCAGQMGFLANWRLPARPELRELVLAVKPSPRVFSTPGGFLRHHAGEDYDPGMLERALRPDEEEYGCPSRESSARADIASRAG